MCSLHILKCDVINLGHNCINRNNTPLSQDSCEHCKIFQDNAWSDKNTNNFIFRNEIVKYLESIINLLRKQFKTIWMNLDLEYSEENRSRKIYCLLMEIEWFYLNKIVNIWMILCYNFFWKKKLAMLHFNNHKLKSIFESKSIWIWNYFDK